MLNARIRKVFVKRNVPIFSIGDPGDLTYNYNIIGKNTDDINKILKKESEFSKTFLLQKNQLLL